MDALRLRAFKAAVHLTESKAYSTKPRQRKVLLLGLLRQLFDGVDVVDSVKTSPASILLDRLVGIEVLQHSTANHGRENVVDDQ